VPGVTTEYPADSNEPSKRSRCTGRGRKTFSNRDVAANPQLPLKQPLSLSLSLNPWEKILIYSQVQENMRALTLGTMMAKGKGKVKRKWNSLQSVEMPH